MAALATLMLEILTPGGVLSFSRWYVEEQPNQVYRLVSLAAASLSEMGEEDPSKHIIVVRNIPPDEVTAILGTVLVGRRPFSDEDLDALEEI